MTCHFSQSGRPRGQGYDGASCRLGVPVVWIVVVWGLCWGSPIEENYHEGLGFVVRCCMQFVAWSCLCPTWRQEEREAALAHDFSGLQKLQASLHPGMLQPLDLRVQISKSVVWTYHAFHLQAPDAFFRVLKRRW